jgi:septal ring factor EnvC (AmiA/AmiB activator)
MTETSAIEVATRRLTQALDALESAVDRRCEADRGTEGLAAQLHSLVNDRSKLAADLDAAAARARGLETTNREVARRLEAAIETIRSVLAANED